jgi:hypothetical protein
MRLTKRGMVIAVGLLAGANLCTQLFRPTTSRPGMLLMPSRFSFSEVFY